MRVLSGITTSGQGELHLGNYVGAVKQHIELQNDNEVYYMMANLHAITVPHAPEQVKENVYKIAALYLALGLDPEKSTLFVQSLVPAHTELTWLLNTIAYMGEMRRMTQFKDKAGDDQDAVSVGLFDYPVLQAADILLYRPDIVPVGEDQKQHIELTRNLAERFNNRFGDTFVLPEPHIPQKAARIMGLDNPTKKMSKSASSTDNYISLLDPADTIQSKMKRAVTDSDNAVRYDKEAKPAISNLLVIFEAISGRGIESLENEYGTTGYGRFKNDLADVIIDFLAPVQSKYQAIITDRSGLDALLRGGSEKASVVAKKTLTLAKEKMGVL